SLMLITARMTPPALSQDNALGQSTAAADQKYTCLMHPEVISDKPGECPKCGMPLVPVKEKKKHSPVTHATDHSSHQAAEPNASHAHGAADSQHDTPAMHASHDHAADHHMLLSSSVTPPDPMAR